MVARVRGQHGAAGAARGKVRSARNRTDAFPPVSRFQTLLNKAEQIASGGQREISISIATNVHG